MKNFNISSKHKLTEMNVLQHEMNDLNINNHAHNGNEDNKVEDNLNEVKEVLNCSFCNKHVYPKVEKYTPMFVYIIILLLFVFISFFTIFLLPLIFLSFKQKKYTCPLCNKNLTSPEKIFKIKKENQILTFQFPKCAIIISIKYLILFLSLIFLIFLFYIIRKTSDFNLDNLARGPYIAVSWIDYLEDCGNKSQFRNKFNSIRNFKGKYYGNTVKWRGSFHHIKEGLFNSNSLFIKMNPSEYRYDKPDIRALFSNSLISQIETLQKNDFIEFECTLLEISKHKSPHLCLLWNVILLEKFEPKNFNVVDFIKQLSIINMINNNANPNPFFININDKNNNVRRSIKIIHFSNNGFKSPNTIHDKEQYMFNLLNNSINNSHDENLYSDKINRKPYSINKEGEEEEDYDEEDFNEGHDIYEDTSNYDDFNYRDMDEDNMEDNNFHHRKYFDPSKFEEAYTYEREFEKEKEDSSNHEWRNKNVDNQPRNANTYEKNYEKKNQEIDEIANQEIDKTTNQKIDEKTNQEKDEKMNQEIDEKTSQEKDEQTSQEKDEQTKQGMSE